LIKLAHNSLAGIRAKDLPTTAR